MDSFSEDMETSIYQSIGHKQQHVGGGMKADWYIFRKLLSWLHGSLDSTIVRHKDKHYASGVPSVP